MQRLKLLVRDQGQYEGGQAHAEVFSKVFLLVSEKHLLHPVVHSVPVDISNMSIFYIIAGTY